MPPCTTTSIWAPELAAWIRATEVEASTPALKAADWAQPLEQVLLELRSTVPLKTLGPKLSRLPYWSLALTLRLKLLPAVWGPMAPSEVVVMVKWSKPAGLTAKPLETPLG